METLGKRPNLLFLVAIRGTIPEKLGGQGYRVSDDLMRRVKLKLFNSDKKIYKDSTKEVKKAAKNSYKYYNVATCLYYRLVRIGMFKEFHFRRKVVVAITVMKKRDFGENKSTTYMINQKLHRESFTNEFPGPAHVASNANESVIEWRFCGKLHRDNLDIKGNYLPAKISHNHRYSQQTDSYYVHGLLHRTDGPAELTYKHSLGKSEIVGTLSVYSINGNRIHHRMFQRLTMPKENTKK